MSATDSPEDRANKIRGYKAALHNPNVSEEAKENAKRQLEALGADEFDYHSGDRDAQNKDPERVEAGLKAALHNPRVTEEGKEQAKQKLESLEKGQGNG